MVTYLEWIETSGLNSYINTGYKPGSDSTLEIDWYPTQTGKDYWGTQSPWFGIRHWSGYQCVISPSGNAVNIGNISTTEFNHFVMDRNGIYNTPGSGETAFFAYGGTVADFTNTLDFYVGKINEGQQNGASGTTFGEIKFLVSNEVVKDYVPAQSGNVVGLYEEVEGVFYAPTEGTFNAGPVKRLFRPSKEFSNFEGVAGSDTFEIEADGDWYLLNTPIAPYFSTVSPSSGTSGITTVTVSVDNWSGETSREENLFFVLSGVSASFTYNVKQDTIKAGVHKMKLGEDTVGKLYLGDLRVSKAYLGNDLVYSKSYLFSGYTKVMSFSDLNTADTYAFIADNGRALSRVSVKPSEGDAWRFNRSVDWASEDVMQVKFHSYSGISGNIMNKAYFYGDNNFSPPDSEVYGHPSGIALGYLNSSIVFRGGADDGWNNAGRLTRTENGILFGCYMIDDESPKYVKAYTNGTANCAPEITSNNVYVYKVLEYKESITSNGTYFDLGFIPTRDTKIVLDFEINGDATQADSDRAILGYYNGWKESGAYLFGYNKQDGNFMGYIGGAYNLNTGQYSYNTRMSVEVTHNQIKYSGNTYNISGNYQPQSDWNCWLGAASSQSGSFRNAGKFTWYNIKVLEGDDLIMNLVPVEHNGYGCFKNWVDGTYLQANDPTKVTINE